MPGHLCALPPQANVRSPRLLNIHVADILTTGYRQSERQSNHSDVHETRKRSRADTGSRSSCTTCTKNPWRENVDASSPDSASVFDARSPPDLANDRYHLAGGIEGTPGFGEHSSNYDDYFSLEMQRHNLWSAPATPAPSSDIQHRRQFLAQAAHLAAQNTTQQPWVLNQLLSIVGGVAGKLVRFCAVPFRGFSAGSGQKYAFSNAEVAAKLGFEDEQEHMAIALPGDFPHDDCDHGVRSIDSLESHERRRLSKRLRTGESWVLVDHEGNAHSRPSSPRLSSRRLPVDGSPRSPSRIPRPVSRASSTRRPSLIPASRRSTYDRRHLSHQPITSGRPSHVRQNSHTSPFLTSTLSTSDGPNTTTSTDSINKPRSPLPLESQRLINKVRREEYEDDARMRRMSCQMKDMLREAREALGTRVDVDEGVFGGKQGDDEWDSDGDGDGEGDHARSAMFHAQKMQHFPR